MVAIRTRDEAISSVNRSLGVWVTSVEGALLQSQSTASNARDVVERVLRERANRVHVLETRLGLESDGSIRDSMRVELSRARVLYEQAREARIRVEEVAATIAGLRRQHRVVSDLNVGKARSALEAMHAAIRDYRAIGGGGVRVGEQVGITALPQGGDAASPPIGDIPTDCVDLSELPIVEGESSQGFFGKGGLTRADYRWAVQTWHESVGPAYADGATREDLAAWDARVSAPPLRRMADVLDLFIGSERIRVEARADGRFSIINGRHRFLIARELGIERLPGEVL